MYGKTYVNMIESGKNNEVAWGNQLSQIFIEFHMAMHGDPLEYVARQRRLYRKKNSLEVMSTHKTSAFFLKMFGLKRYTFYQFVLICLT